MANNIRNSVVSGDVARVRDILGTSAASLNLERVYTDSRGAKDTILDIARQMHADMGRIVDMLQQKGAPTAEQVAARGKPPRHRSRSRGRRNGSAKNRSGGNS